ncbi:MAG TPA: dynamin family protein [Thermohalobaculum sp.]|nr:dynamin family protein [Thermohalobaculum sp.]
MEAEPDLFRVAVVGEFSSGKSSVLNLLANEPVIPANVEYSAMPPISLTWGRQRSLSLVTRRGVRGFGTFSELPDGAWAGSDRISIELPETGFAGIEFLEIPFHPDAEFADAVLPLLADVDMAIWCTPANQALKLTEIADIGSVPADLLQRSVLAVTRADLLEAADREKVLRRLRREVGETFAAIIFISASPRFCETAFDPEVWTESGGAALMAAIREQGGDALADPAPEDDGDSIAEDWSDDIEGRGQVIQMSARFAAAKKAAAERQAAEGKDGAAEPAQPESEQTTPRPSRTEAEETFEEPDLSPFEGLAGFAGAVLVDSISGLVLCGKQTPSLKLDAAASAAATATAALEPGDDPSAEILLAIGKRYHLVRPLTSNPQVYLYLVLDRLEANLGLARMIVKTVESRIDLS